MGVKEDDLALKIILSEGIIGVNWEGKGSYLKLGSSGLDITCFCMNVDDISCKRILENQKIYKLRFLINLTIVWNKGKKTLSWRCGETWVIVPILTLTALELPNESRGTWWHLLRKGFHQPQVKKDNNYKQWQGLRIAVTCHHSKWKLSIQRALF